VLSINYYWVPGVRCQVSYDRPNRGVHDSLRCAGVLRLRAVGLPSGRRRLILLGRRRSRLGTGDFPISPDDAFLLRRVENQVTVLTFRRRFEPRTAIVKHADSTGFGQFEIALLRANGIEDRRHGPSRRVIGHLLVRPIGVNDGMFGGPGKVLLDACCREEQHPSYLVGGGDNSCRPLGEELLRCWDVGPDVEVWWAGWIRSARKRKESHLA